MRTSKDHLDEIERLYDLYQEEVKGLESDGTLSGKTVNTYLPHAYNFVRWCRGEFTPGIKNKEKYK